jgi:Domain of unknown function (DUF1854)
MSFPAGENTIDPSAIRLFREPEWVLCLIIDGCRYSGVVVVRAAPLTSPDRYMCFLDANGNEICMVKDPSLLDANSQRIVREELSLRYLTSEIRRIYSATSEAGACHFDAETSRGRRQFIIRETQETVRWLGQYHLLLVDVDGNRFAAPDMRRLDLRSARLLRMLG